VFRADVERLSTLDRKERGNWEKTRKYHGAAWEKSWRFVEKVGARQPFAGVALQWLVPEPLFCVRRVTFPHGKKWKRRPAFSPRLIEVGEGTTPNTTDRTHWRWWKNSRLANHAGRLIRRGPEVHWTTSRIKRLRDKVDPLKEWRDYFKDGRTFKMETPWRDAPPQFRRQFQFIWRSRFDCRPTNPISKDRSDSPHPHESNFFHSWRLDGFRASNLSHENLVKMLKFNELADNYRIFAVPKTILTKASANVMGKWMTDELKRGSRLYGDLLKDGLLNEAELFGTTPEWTEWLARNTQQTSGSSKDSHFYRRCHYMDSLVALVYPLFDIAKLLAPPKHRARGKKYVPKGGQK
jgi:hypothetical protein